MTVNGSPRWTCRTHVSEVLEDGNRVRIGPLRNLPVIKDLATDMTEFFDKWARASGQFRPTAPESLAFAQVSPNSKERREADAGIECIGCGVCYAACDVVNWNKDYLDRPPSTGPGRWSTTYGMGNATPISPPLPSMPAAMRATRTATAPTIARKGSIPPHPSPA